MKLLYPPFFNEVNSHQLIQNGYTIILGFSGGKDSVTLFYLLQELKKNIQFQIIVAYFNHKIRKDSSKEQQWVQTFCKKNNVELVIGSKNIIQFKNSEKLNLEHAASLSRYQFFKQISLKYKNAKIATAHTQSDLTETFFIKLFRGSGLQGLSTIFSKKENIIIRPILIFDQEQIENFLNRNNINYYQDYSNKQDIFLRNRIRHHLIPEIKKIEPNLNNHIFTTVSIIQEEYNYFNQLAQKILQKHLILGKILPTSIIPRYHISVQRHIIREYLRLLKGNLLNIDYQHIENIRILHKKVKGLAIPGIELSFYKGYIFPHHISIPQYKYFLKKTGSINIKEINKKIILEKLNIFKQPKDNFQIVIPFEKVQFPLMLRNVNPEDKYRKINTHINQKVFEMIRSSGLPAQLRNLHPIILNGNNEIIWVLGSPVADNFKVLKNNLKEFLSIKILNRH